jgi:UDP:flavonoid glycosyltransferase YjiC (YdhE family)
VLTQPSYRQAARRVADSMGKLGGIREAADRIERLAAGHILPHHHSSEVL